MKKNYRNFYLMTLASLLIMFAVMYAMVATIDHIYLNVNRLYMAVLMVAPMLLLRIYFMPSMYKDKKQNQMIMAGAALIFVLVFFLVRTQGLVHNKQFLRSMITHHSSAILMCEESTLTEPEIMTLCDQIVNTQKKEISEMQMILKVFRGNDLKTTTD